MPPRHRSGPGQRRQPTLPATLTNRKIKTGQFLSLRRIKAARERASHVWLPGRAWPDGRLRGLRAGGRTDGRGRRLTHFDPHYMHFKGMKYGRRVVKERWPAGLNAGCWGSKAAEEGGGDWVTQFVHTCRGCRGDSGGRLSSAAPTPSPAGLAEQQQPAAAVAGRTQQVLRDSGKAT